MIDHFQDINRLITGIATAPSSGATPQTLDAVSLPCALTLPGPASWHGRGWKATRQYVVRVYVAAADTDAGVAFGAGIRLIDAVGETYARRPGSIGPAVMIYTEGAGLSDSGFLGVLPYAGIPYFAVEFRITVKEPD